MKIQEGFTLFELIVTGLFIIWITAWTWNTVKLCSCDFLPDYKCEIVHGIGTFVPPLSVVTVWFKDDGNDK